jgi:hypothetical protein
MERVSPLCFIARSTLTVLQFRRPPSGATYSTPSLSLPSKHTSKSSRSPLGRTISGALKRLTLREEEYHNADNIAKGPLGLVQLHESPDALIDFIFIHGLGGGSQKTWSSASRPYHYWPKHWLSREEAFARVCIHSFGYKADWTEKNESLSSIHDFARSLINALYCDSGIRRGNVGVKSTHCFVSIDADRPYE